MKNSSKMIEKRSIMKKIVILTESGADLPKELAEKRLNHKFCGMAGS